MPPAQRFPRRIKLTQRAVDRLPAPHPGGKQGSDRLADWSSAGAEAAT